MRHSALLRFLLVALLSLHARADAAPRTMEAEPHLDSAAIVQPALLSGPNFTVAPQARVHGYMARFTLQTPFGEIVAESAELLAIREAEMSAIEALDRASRTEVFARALAQVAKNSGTAVWNVVRHPVDSVAGMPAGVARYFGKKLRGWRNRAQSVSDRAAREFGSDGDPFRSASGPLRATRRPMSGERTTKSDNHAWYAKAGREVGREVKRQVDYSKRRREMAAHLGIDPHSSNPLIVARLDALAWAAVAGNVSAETAIGAIGGGAGEVLSTSGKINALVWQADPEDLRERNRQRLLALCSDDFAVRQFLRRGGFTDTLRTALIDEIERLRPDTGCNDLVELAAGTRSELEARFLVNALRLLRRHAGAARGDLVVAASTIAWRSRDGELALPLPLDWLSWTTDIDAFFDQPLFRVANKIALVGGEVSLPAQRALTERGWNMELRSVYEGSPPYADEIASGLRVDGDDVPVTPLCFETDIPGTCG